MRATATGMTVDRLVARLNELEQENTRLGAQLADLLAAQPLPGVPRAEQPLDSEERLLDQPTSLVLPPPGASASASAMEASA